MLKNLLEKNEDGLFFLFFYFYFHAQLDSIREAPSTQINPIQSNGVGSALPVLTIVGRDLKVPVVICAWMSNSLFGHTHETIVPRCFAVGRAYCHRHHRHHRHHRGEQKPARKTVCHITRM